MSIFKNDPYQGMQKKRFQKKKVEKCCHTCEYVIWDEEYANVSIGCSKGNTLDWAYSGNCNEYKAMEGTD